MNKFDLSALNGRKILILGLGVENLALVKFLNPYGFAYTIADEKTEEELVETLDEIKSPQVSFFLGPNYLDVISQFEVIFRTPGISPLTPQLDQARSQGILITSQMQLFMDLCPTEHVIGVTGTKGKGTTSTLIANILERSGRKVFLGGNIGIPPLEFINELDGESRVVLELSSFQLADLKAEFSTAVVLMTTAEHLDYHANEEEYVDAKKNLVRFQSQTDRAVVNIDYPNSSDFVLETKARIYQVSRLEQVERGAFVRERTLVFKDEGGEENIVDLTKVKLRGQHNWENIAAAVAATKSLRVPTENVQEAVYNFIGLEHRLELVKTLNNVVYYNDSFSTTPETTIAAIKSFSEPITLILGGSSKNSDFSSMAKEILLNPQVQTIILIGQESDRIKEALTEYGHFSGDLVEGLTSMDAVVREANEITPSGGVVLLSPACASFDMFHNYKHRGEEFKRAVLSLI